MVNVVHVEYHLDDRRTIRKLEIKIKSFRQQNDEKTLSGHPLAATIGNAFFRTTLLTDENAAFEVKPNPKRGDIFDVLVSFEKNNLTYRDISNFLEAFQEAMDNTNLGF